MQINNNILLQIFYKMLKARLFEEKLVALYEKLNIPLYLSYGQEASIGAVVALNDDDIVFAGHRSNALAIARDIDTTSLFNEYIGNDFGINRGQNGLTSFICKEKNFYAHDAIASHILQSVGVGITLKTQRKKNAVACFLGDGAASLGYFYEALNIASLKGLSIIFFVENNGYTGNTPAHAVHNIEDIANRGKGFDIPCILADGNNAIDIYSAMCDAREYAVTRHSPILIESKTYRLTSNKYLEEEHRSENELKAWMDYDAIDNLMQAMLKNNIGKQQDFMMIRKTIEKQMQISYQQACENIVSKTNNSSLFETEDEEV